MHDNIVFRREKISDRLYNDLLNSILVGDFPPLSSLPTESRLADEYGISRTTVRAALAQLKNEGFVTSRQGSGTIVSGNNRIRLSPFASVESLVDLEKCYECRIVLEPGIAAIAAELRTDADIIFFEQHIQSFQQRVETGASQTSDDAEFHLYLARVSGNKFLETIMASLRPHILFGMNIIKILPDKARRRHTRTSLREHQKIVQAIVEKNGASARQMMRNHLNNSRQRIFKGNSH